MVTYATQDEFAAALWTALAADADNPVAAYAHTFQGKPRGLISKYQRCPKLKVAAYSTTEPIWTGSVQFNGASHTLAQVIEQLMAF